MSPDGATLNSHGYGLNVGDQRTSQTRKGPGYTNTVDYGYDPLGQLLTATGKEVDGSTRRRPAVPVSPPLRSSGQSETPHVVAYHEDRKPR